jgi:glutathione S-transferase
MLDNAKCYLVTSVQSFSEDGSVVWESKDILLALEERFPHASPLLPTDEEEKQKVSQTFIRSSGSSM